MLHNGAPQPLAPLTLKDFETVETLTAALRTEAAQVRPGMAYSELTITIAK